MRRWKRPTAAIPPPGSIELDKLKNNLHATLTLSDPFLPHAGLRQATDKLYEDG